MSSLKTDNLNLHKWSGADKVLVEEFNENFDTLDAAVSNVVTTDVLNNRLDASNTAINAVLNLKAAQAQVDAMAAQLNELMRHDILLRLTVVNGILHVDGVPVGAGGSTDAAFGLIGKWFSEAEEGLTVYSSHYPGATIRTDISGSESVTARFKYTGAGWTETPMIAVRINNGSWTRYPMSDSVEIASGLPLTGTHTLEIVFDGWNQADNLWNNQRKFTFKGLTIDQGGTSSYINTRQNVLFIGDSITAGTRSLANGDNANQSSATLSYSQFLGDIMGENIYRSAFPGAKVTEAFTRQNVTQVTYGTPVPSYNIGTIIVAMGTNDYGKDSAEFVTNYQLLINAIRTIYPSVRIYIVGLFESNVSLRRNAELATIAANPANTKITHINTDALTGVTFTDGLHPDAAGGIAIRDYIYDVLVADEWFNGGGALNPTPTVPEGNLWALGGNPTSYDPLPAGWHSIAFPGNYAGNTFRVSFTGSSASGATLVSYTENQPLGLSERATVLTPTPKAYSFTFDVSFAGDGNHLYFKRGNFELDTDIVLSDIVVEKV